MSTAETSLFVYASQMLQVVCRKCRITGGHVPASTSPRLLATASHLYRLCRKIALGYALAAGFPGILFCRRLLAEGRLSALFGSFRRLTFLSPSRSHSGGQVRTAAGADVVALWVSQSHGVVCQGKGRMVDI